jgi:hypothetical protein
LVKFENIFNFASIGDAHMTGTKTSQTAHLDDNKRPFQEEIFQSAPTLLAAARKPQVPHGALNSSLFSLSPADTKNLLEQAIKNNQPPPVEESSELGLRTRPDKFGMPFKLGQLLNVAKIESNDGSVYSVVVTNTNRVPGEQQAAMKIDGKGNITKAVCMDPSRRQTPMTREYAQEILKSLKEAAGRK